MTSCPEALRILGIWKKAVSWDLNSEQERRFSVLAEARPVWVYGMPARWLSRKVEIQTWARPDDFVRYGRGALFGWVEGWDFGSEQVSRFPELAEARPVVCCWDSTWCGSDGKVRIERNCVSLLMLKNLKLKKVIKSFVPEPKESRQVFRMFSDSYMSINILWTYHVFISWSYIFFT